MSETNNRPAVVGQVDRELGLRARLRDSASEVDEVEQGWGPADRLCKAAREADAELHRMRCEIDILTRRLREGESLVSRIGSVLARCRTQIEAYEGACYSEPPPMPPISALLADIDAVLGPNVNSTAQPAA